MLAYESLRMPKRNVTWEGNRASDGRPTIRKPPRASGRHLTDRPHRQRLPHLASFDFGRRLLFTEEFQLNRSLVSTWLRSISGSRSRSRCEGHRKRWNKVLIQKSRCCVGLDGHGTTHSLDHRNRCCWCDKLDHGVTERRATPSQQALRPRTSSHTSEEHSWWWTMSNRVPWLICRSMTAAPAPVVENVIPATVLARHQCLWWQHLQHLLHSLRPRIPIALCPRRTVRCLPHGRSFPLNGNPNHFFLATIFTPDNGHDSVRSCHNVPYRPH